MADIKEIKSAVAGMADAFEAWKANRDPLFRELAESQGRLADRLEDLETRASRPAHAINHSAAEREHMARFKEWMKRPNDSATKNALSDFEAAERKTLSIGNNAAGGFAVPEEIAREIERQELLFSPVRRLVKVRRTATNDFKALVNVRGASSGWVGETDSRTETDTPALRERTPTMGELFAYPQVTEWALDDMFFDVGAWLAEEVAQEFAVQEGTAVISGNGSNRPTGMLNTTPVTNDDGSPTRAADAYEYITGAPISSPTVAEISADALVDLVYAVNSAYRARGTFVMNSTTAAAVRKLKDTTGRFLWSDGLSAGQPNRLLGFPVETWEQMQDVGTNNFPIAFGDFMRGYILADRTEIRITTDSNITTPGRIKYFVRRREGGCVLDNNAIKWLRTTIS